jgi:hypothetical protein
MSFFTDHFSWKGTVYGGAALLLGLMPPDVALVLQAADPPPSQLPQQTPRDWLLTTAARRAFQKDEQLAALNVGVSVNNKVATIWGTIPSLDLARRAEEVLKKVGGIAAVMNDCRIVANDTLPEAVADAVKKGRTPGDEIVANTQLTVWPPPPKSTSQRVVAKLNPDELAPRAKGDVNELAPGAPLLPLPPAAVLLSPVPNETAKGSTDCETVRRSDERFKDVTLDLKEGIVRMNGKVAQMKDAWELAERLNELASVKQVILGNVAEK